MASEMENRKAYVERAVVRQRGAVRSAGSDRVAEEMPVALVFNGITHAVMMASPSDLDVFGAGFALSEGIVVGRADIYEIDVRWHADSAELQISIAQQAFQRLKGQRRVMAGRSGCGLCGIESLAQLDLQPEKIAAPLLPDDLPAALRRAADGLGERQQLMQITGGVHAAAWCGLDGEILAVFEDVGRHNALDKLIGHLALAGIDAARGFVFMSSRASYELVRKAARMRIGMLATISAPSSLAIDIAAQAGLKLVSFCRQDGFVEYT